MRSIPTKSFSTLIPPSTSSDVPEMSCRSWLIRVGQSSGQSGCAMSEMIAAFTFERDQSAWDKVTAVQDSHKQGESCARDRTDRQR